MIITFDNAGVSSHANHIAIFHGISYLMEKKMIPVEVMTLTTVMIVRKYLGLIDVCFIWTNEWHCFRFNFIEAYRTLALHKS